MDFYEDIDRGSNKGIRSALTTLGAVALFGLTGPLESHYQSDK